MLPKYLIVLEPGGKEIEDLKVVINDMVAKHLIKNTGKGDSDSFVLVEGISGDVNHEQENEVERETDEDGNAGALEAFINESLQNTLHEKIRAEVKKVLGETPNIYKDLESNSLKQANHKDHTDELIASLKNEITFLRQELLSKDSIIKLLINNNNTSINTKSKQQQYIH